MEEYNKVAAKWWADRLRTPGLKKSNNGDKSPHGGMAMTMGAILSIKTEKEDSNDIDRFEELLADIIKERVEANGSLMLHVDYGPDDILYETARSANVISCNWPWKSIMWIKPSFVKVRLGFGAHEETIFSAE